MDLDIKVVVEEMVGTVEVVIGRENEVEIGIIETDLVMEKETIEEKTAEKEITDDAMKTIGIEIEGRMMVIVVGRNDPMEIETGNVIVIVVGKEREIEAGIEMTGKMIVAQTLTGKIKKGIGREMERRRHVGRKMNHTL